MRGNFVKQLSDEMRVNKNIFFLTGDLGFNALEPLQKEFPDRFINVGIAEANMVGIAAGLALTGKKVIVYSIASFVSMRPYEQIRNDICYHNLDVKIIGTGGGFNYGNHGITHHTLEDIAIMSALPNMKVFSPAYTWETTQCTKAVLEDTGPCYMRIGKNPGTDYSQKKFKFKIGRTYNVKEGEEILLLSTGNILDYAMEAAVIIKEKTGLSVCVHSVPTIKPIDKKGMAKLVKEFKFIATIEENSVYGGLGSQIALVLVEQGISTPFIPFTIPDIFIKTVGGRNHLLKEAELDPISISKKIIWRIKQKK